jgi:hypothetical protein
MHTHTYEYAYPQRHVIGEGLAGQWEMMSVRYAPPVSLYGEGALKTLQNVWSNGENFMGRACGLGFLFVYALLQGQTRCKVVSGGYFDWWLGDNAWGADAAEGGAGGTGSDSHRFGVLLTQLYDDRHSKSVSMCAYTGVCVCVWN